MHHPREVRGDGVEFMGSEDDGDAIVVEFVEQVQHVVASLDVDPSGGFVEEQELRVAHKRPGEEHTLLLPARQRADVAAAEVVDAQPRHRLGGCLTICPRRPGEDAAAGRKAHHHDFFDGRREVPVDALDLGNIP